MANEVANETPDGMKKCIACRELIPADATICYHCQTRQTPEPPAKSDRVKPVMAWVGYTSAVIGLGATLLGGLRWLQTHHQENSATTTQIAIAENQRQRGEYETAFHTYQAILKSDPQNRKAVDGQVDAAMLWLDDFHVVGAPDNDKTIPPQAAAKR